MFQGTLISYKKYMNDNNSINQTDNVEIKQLNANDTFNNSNTNTAAGTISKAVLQFDNIDLSLAVFVIFLAFMSIKYFGLFTFATAHGVWASIYITLYLGTLFTYAKLKKVKPTRDSIYMAIITFALGISFSFIYNLSLAGFIKLYICVAIIYLPMKIFGLGYKKQINALSVLEYLQALLILPFMNYLAQFKAFNQIFKQYKLNKSTIRNAMWIVILGNVFFGILIAIPFLLTLAAMFSSADENFYNITKSIFDGFSIDMGNNIPIFFFSIPLAAYLYGLIYGSAYKLTGKNKSLTDNQSTIKKLAIIPAISCYTLLLLASIMHIIFILIQLSYYIQIYSGLMPSGFTYAEYARRGFFELMCIAFIDIIIISLCRAFTKEYKNKNPMHFFISLISILSMLIISIALAKMFLYISVYGLTSARVISSVIMLYMFIVFILIIISEFKSGLELTRISFYVGSAMFLILSYSNMDVNIMKYNVNNYILGHLESFDTEYIFYQELSSIPAVYDILNRDIDESLKEDLILKVNDYHSSYYFDYVESSDYNIARTKYLTQLHEILNYNPGVKP